MSRYGFYNELIGNLNESEEKKGERKGGREDKEERGRKPELNSHLQHSWI